MLRHTLRDLVARVREQAGSGNQGWIRQHRHGPPGVAMRRFAAAGLLTFGPSLIIPSAPAIE
jgi:hypothetical protein